MGGKCSSNRISTTLPRTEVTAPKLVVFFMFAFADPHLRHPSRHCIRQGAHPGCTGPGDRELAVPPKPGFPRLAKSPGPVAGWRGHTKTPTPKADATDRKSVV